MTRPCPRPLPHGDGGSMVIGWLVKIAVVLVAVGIFAFDGIAVAVGRVDAQDAAGLAADAGADSYRDSGSIETAYEQARTAAVENGATLSAREFVVFKDGSVQVTVHRSVNTIVLKYLGPAKSLTQISQTALVKAIVQ